MPAKYKIHAVLTGDIVNSSRFPAAEEKLLLAALNSAFDTHLYEYYRGDSFQAYINDPRLALKVALLCRAITISFTEDYESIPYDVRISIGIGIVDQPVKKLSTAKGEAFLLSGRHLDEIAKTSTRLIITTGNELANAGLRVLADYINSIYDHMTARQAQVISRLLVGNTQQSIAEELEKSKSTVHQLTVSGRWLEIEKLLQQYENLINYLL
jgi:hypothetical protein